ncbi:MAG: hypothetical protein AB7S54_01475 [Bacteroidales bacterium]
MLARSGTMLGGPPTFASVELFLLDSFPGSLYAMSSSEWIKCAYPYTVNP